MQAVKDSFFHGGAGAFAAFIPNSQFEGQVVGGHILRVTGDLFLIGDPAHISVQIVPEPSTFVLGGLGLLGLLACACGKRRIGHAVQLFQGNIVANRWHRHFWKTPGQYTLDSFKRLLLDPSLPALGAALYPSLRSLFLGARRTRE